MSASTTVKMTVNGAPVVVHVEPRTSLADCVREQLHLTGTHLACEQGVCGACTILLDGKPVRSCITWAVSCEGADVRTIEGFESDPSMQSLREAFTREHALQCGFCTPGMLVTARDIVQRLPGCDESRIRHELSGNICRCTGYAGIVRAVCAVAGAGQPALAAAHPAPPPLQPFEPVAQDPAPAAPVASRMADAGTPGAQITEMVVVKGCDAQQLWALLSDVRAAAGCLPGARVDRQEGQTVYGAVRVAFGPMKAEFVGEGELTRDDANRSAVIRGDAADARSRTTAKAEITYRVEPEPAAADAARLVIGIRYDVQGPLAQFSRSDLVRSLVSQLLRDFGRNLEAFAAGRAAPAETRFNAMGLVWRWLVESVRKLFGTEKR